METDSDYSKYVYDGDTGWIYGTQADILVLSAVERYEPDIIQTAKELVEILNKA